MKLTHESELVVGEKYSYEGDVKEYIGKASTGHFIFFDGDDFSWFDDAEHLENYEPFTPVRPIEEVMADMVEKVILYQNIVEFNSRHDRHHENAEGAEAEKAIAETQALLAEAQALGVVE